MGAKSKDVIVNCLTCGKTITTTESQVKFGKDKYCSVECSSQRNKKRISNEYLIREFNRFILENKRVPFVKEMSGKNGYPESSTYERRWGSWNNFLSFMGVIREDYWSKEDEEFLRKHYADKDIDYIIANLQIKRDWKTQITKKASLMGLKRNKEQKTVSRRYSDEFLVSEFYRYLNEFNIYPNAVDFRKNKNYPSPSSYERRYGSWTNFLRYIDVLGTDGWYKCDEQVLIDMYAKHTTEEINQRLMFKRSESTIQHKANSMGLIKQNYTELELLDYLKRFYLEFGRTPTNNEFINLDDYPSPSYYRTRFGSWNKALTEANLPLNTYVRTEDKDFVYEQIRQDYIYGLELDEIATKHGYSSGAAISVIINKFDVEKRNNLWSKEQIELLEEHYSYMDWNDLIKLLNPFSKEDIITKAHKIGLKRLNYYWTEEEELFLKENYGSIQIEEILQKLHTKTYIAIINKANKIGLKSREKWTDEELCKLREVYSTRENKELVQFFPNRKLPAIVSTARDVLGLEKDPSLLLTKKENTKSLLLRKLIQFSKELGRTPTIIDIHNNDDMGGAISYSRYFGSYQEACRIANLEPNTSVFGRHNCYFSKNNDLCLSKPELDITNLFIDNGIKYEKEVLYNEIVDDDRCGLKRVDWLLSNSIIIEYFGMMDKSYYRERAKEKMKICEDNNIILIDIYPSDLSYNYQGLINKLKSINIEMTI